VFNCSSTARQGGVLSYLDGSIGQVVQGIVFEVDEDGLAVLDMKEGAKADGRGQYVRREVTVLTEDGGVIDAVTYQANPLNTVDSVAPHEDYVKVVRKGYLAHMLRENNLLDAARNEPRSFLIQQLFTYGTLMRGECRSRHLFPDKARLARSAVAKGMLLDLGSYPGMVVAEDDASQVLGELCELVSPAETLGCLDRVEGFVGYGKDGSLFRRAIVSVTTAGGLVHPAWVYLYNQPGSNRVVPGGNWKERGARNCSPVSASGISMDRMVWCIWATMNDLVHLRDTIDSDDYKKLCTNIRPWGGADVIISDAPVPGTPKTVVVTQCWRELSWLFEMLKEYFCWHIDYLNKFEFYGLLADAAAGYITEAGEAGALHDHGSRYEKGLLNRVIDRALCLLDDLDMTA
jgi:gamma-glutamylcyclotransferase (GGCT)/AIG2-like uncharacterized protein YtfP